MRKNGVNPSCKTLTRETKLSDFVYAETNAETMNAARGVINSKMNRDELIKQWKTNHDGEIRMKKLNKEKYGRNGGRIPHTTQGTKGPRNKLNHLHGLQHHGNINIIRMQDAQKIIPVQVIQGPDQQHRRRMGLKLLHGG